MSSSADAGLARRLAAIPYELLLLAAMAFVAGFVMLPFVSPQSAVRHDLATPPLYARTLMACVLAGGATLFYAWIWSGGRRSLPQKVWHLRLVDQEGRAPGWKQALLRALLAWIGPVLALAAWPLMHAAGHGRYAALFVVFNYAWALVDRDRRFLHDRLAGTRLVAG
ncbi:MAG: RDD family protein [Proteobacteria bacterium]|nr:RDD family protein [Pseudomonadota bacterium]